jgi:phosphoglycerate dehydrogenase-like enzyme
VVEVRRGDPPPVDVDVLTLHCSLDRANTGMVDTAFLDRLASHAVLINTARGKLLDATAAARAVHEGRLGGLGIDVFPEEPAVLAPFVHPAIVVTPHAAGWHPGLGRAIAEGVAGAVRAHLACEPVPWSI